MRPNQTPRPRFSRSRAAQLARQRRSLSSLSGRQLGRSLLSPPAGPRTSSTPSHLSFFFPAVTRAGEVSSPSRIRTPRFPCRFRGIKPLYMPQASAKLRSFTAPQKETQKNPSLDARLGARDPAEVRRRKPRPPSLSARVQRLGGLATSSSIFPWSRFSIWCTEWRNSMSPSKHTAAAMAPPHRRLRPAGRRPPPFPSAPDAVQPKIDGQD